MSETIDGAGRPAGPGHSEAGEASEAAPDHFPLWGSVGVSADAEKVVDQVPGDEDDRWIAVAQGDAPWSRFATGTGRPDVVALSCLGSGKREDEFEAVMGRCTADLDGDEPTTRLQAFGIAVRSVQKSRYGSPPTLGQQVYEILHELLRHDDDRIADIPVAGVLE